VFLVINNSIINILCGKYIIIKIENVFVNNFNQENW